MKNMIKYHPKKGNSLHEGRPEELPEQVEMRGVPQLVDGEMVMDQGSFSKTRSFGEFVDPFRSSPVLENVYFSELSGAEQEWTQRCLSL